MKSIKKKQMHIFQVFFLNNLVKDLKKTSFLKKQYCLNGYMSIELHIFNNHNSLNLNLF